MIKMAPGFFLLLDENPLLDMALGSFFSTVVRHTHHNQEGVSSNLDGCWTFSHSLSPEE